MPNCPHCAAPIQENDAFCSACGKPIQAASAAPAACSGPARSHHPWRKIGCGCLTVLVLAGALTFCTVRALTDDARDAARGHLALLQKGDVSRAYQQTTPEFQELVSLEQYTELVAVRPVLQTMEEVGFPEFERENNVVTFTAQARFAGGLSTLIPIRLRKEEGQWRVIAIDFSNVPIQAAAAPSVPDEPMPEVNEVPEAPQPVASAQVVQPRSAAPVAVAAVRAEPEEDAARVAARRCLDLITAGQAEQTYEEASPDFKAVTPRKHYLAIFRERPVLRDVESISFTEYPEETQNTRLFRAHVETGGGLRFDVPMRLRLEQGEWRLLAGDWSGVPVGEQVRAGTAQAAAQPVAPVQQAPSVGTVVIGSGRHSDGSLLRPGLPIAQHAERISADIQLIDHTEGDRVQVWVESQDGSARTESIDASIEGSGSGYMPFELKLGEEGIPPGRYRLMVLLVGDRKFATDFEVR